MKIRTGAMDEGGPPDRQLPVNKPADAYSSIKDLIFRKILNPGQKLLYRDLVDMIGMSKTPIINALNRMVYEGLIVYEVNKGYRIRPIDEKEISDLFEIRIELETLNVRKAISGFTEGEYRKLQEAFRQATEYNPEFTDQRKLYLDMAFHLQIAHMGGNSYSAMFLRSVIENIQLRYRLEPGVEGRKSEIVEEHVRVLDYIGKKDTEKAIEYMHKHLKELHRLMLQYLQNFRGQDTGWF